MAAEVQFLADRTCCICHQSGKQMQIHHIDDDPEHNDLDNLALLCLEHHAQTQLSGGFGRKLNATLVRRYKAHWASVVELRRNAEALRTEIDRDSSSESTDPASRTSSDASPLRGQVHVVPAAEAGPPPASRSVPAGESHDSIVAGEHVRTGGIKITLLAIAESDAVNLNKSGYRAGSGFDVLTSAEAGHGAKYVTLQTRVLNDGNHSIDLTCGGPILTHAIDERGRQFDHIGDLSDIPGNPECNVNLQPGFESDMTWIFRVPESAQIARFSFRDISDFSATRPAVTVSVR